ncbi:MAG: nucleotidyltransferase domain-containing protein [Candidatus Cloacimonadales bacterium]|nr:nucleotidyltransferase domain-containing protein [Candidatus Cloacimonadales bacterium]
MSKQDLFNRIKSTISAFDKNATIILYGSRVRGDFSQDSDWDFLILLSRQFGIKEKSLLRHNLYEIELETGEIISALFYEKEHWQSKKNQYSPFYKNIAQDGMVV